MKSPTMDMVFEGTETKQQLKRKDMERDSSYWDRRKRNNEAAKRSRAKRRVNEMALEKRVIELFKENHILRAQLKAVCEKYKINGDNLVSAEEVLATLPSFDQMMQPKRGRFVEEEDPNATFEYMRSRKLPPLPALNPVNLSSKKRPHGNFAEEQIGSMNEDSSSCSSTGWTLPSTVLAASATDMHIPSEAPRTSSSSKAQLNGTFVESEDIHAQLLRLSTEMEQLKNIIIRKNLQNSQ